MSTSRDDFGIAIRSALLQRGARQKFSLFVLILISSLIFAIDNIELKFTKVLRSLINDGVYRISAISSSPIKFSSATKDFFIKHIFIYKENEELNKIKIKLVILIQIKINLVKINIYRFILVDPRYEISFKKINNFYKFLNDNNAEQLFAKRKIKNILFRNRK